MYAPLITAATAVVLDMLLATNETSQKEQDRKRSEEKHSIDTGEAPGDVVNGIYTDGDGTRYVKAFTDNEGTDVFRVEGRTGGLLYQGLTRVPGLRASLWGVPVPPSVASQNTGAINPEDVMRFSDGALYRPNGIQYGTVKDGVFIPGPKTRVAR